MTNLISGTSGPIGPRIPRQTDRRDFLDATSGGPVAGTLLSLPSGRSSYRKSSNDAYSWNDNRANALFARYQIEQAAIGNQVVGAVRALWDHNIDPDHFGNSWRDLADSIKHVITLHYRASAYSAVRYYKLTRIIEGHGMLPVGPALPNTDKLDRVADSVSNGTFFHQLKKMNKPALDASMIARNTMSGAGSRFALMGGRETVMHTVANDTDVIGWERMPSSADACSYCIMHAARGPYKPGMTDFHPHDYCHCVARPLFIGMEPRNQALTELWNKVTEGLTGKAARVAWEGSMSGEGNGNNTERGDGGGPETGQGEGGGTTQQERRGTEVSNA